MSFKPVTAQSRLETSIFNELVRSGHDAYRQARIADIGLIANIVTRQAIFEVENYVDLPRFFEAVGHLLICNAAFHRPAMYLVIGELAYRQDLTVLQRRVDRLGIKIVLWPAWEHDPRFDTTGLCLWQAALLFEAATERGWRP